MKKVVPLLLLALGCASDSGRMYDGPARPRAEVALVEVNRYAQKKTLRWVVTDVSLPDGRWTKGTFEIPPGRYELEIAWRIYDTTEGDMALALLVPIADRAKRIDEGVERIPFTAEAGRFYRLRWASRADASDEGDPADMELQLVAAGLAPELRGEGS